MANYRKRKEQNKLKTRLTRAVAKASQASEANDEVEQSPVPTKRSRHTESLELSMESDLAATSSVRSMSSKTSLAADRQRKHRANLSQ